MLLALLKTVFILFLKPLLNGHELQPLGKYGWLSEKVWPSFPGLFSSPRCGGSTPSRSSGRLTGSSVCSREHLQFHRSPGWCLDQKGSSTGSVSFFSQNFRWEDSGLGDVVGIHRRFGMTSLLRRKDCQSAALWARMMAVSYSVRSHAPQWCVEMEETSLSHCRKGFNFPLASRSFAAMSEPIWWTLKAAKTSLEWRSAARKLSERERLEDWVSPSTVAELMTRRTSRQMEGSIWVEVSKPS